MTVIVVIIVCIIIIIIIIIVITVGPPRSAPWPLLAAPWPLWVDSEAGKAAAAAAPTIQLESL